MCPWEQFTSEEVAAGATADAVTGTEVELRGNGFPQFPQNFAVSMF
jgi:hypothetical protein